ncbi:MAG TPA: hypothetical protein VK327_17450 [Candidatus Paceibacterota bacterium]|nr:hypothetical protein [Candidatus Paceibacterota bacterium]
MKNTLRIFAVLIALAAGGFWFAKGANRGWTKNKVQIETVDEITGIKGFRDEKVFIPGLDVLAIATGISVVVFGISFAFKTKNQKQTPST